MSILKRQIFLDGANRQVRFFDWALVTTTLGAMMEPRNWNQVPSGGKEYDPEDELSRIDEVGSVDILRQMFSFMGAGEVIHGGNQYPQAFDYD